MSAITQRPVAEVDHAGVQSGVDGPAPSAWLVRAFRPGADDEVWDAVVAQSVNGTFLHTRRFLSYHAHRFNDRSLVVEDRGGRVRAVFPAAADPADRQVVVSHPGITFGGLVHDGSVRGGDTVAVLELVADRYRRDGVRVLRYKAVPPIFHRSPAADDAYVLFRMGAVRSRCDLSATIDLDNRLPLGSSRAKPARAARNRGVEVRWDWDACPVFWPLLSEVLGQRHGVVPVHTLAEIELLRTRFPDRIRLITAWVDGELLAGGVMFCMAPVMHLQYSASSPTGRRFGATDAVVEAGIREAEACGYRYYDFGISTEDGGWFLNSSLHDFKLSFGAGSAAFEQYELTL